MPVPPSGADLDTLADLVAQRLLLRGPGGPIPVPTPGGEPDLERPPVVIDRPQLPDLVPRRRLAIAGIELTQAIQHHGAAGPSYGSDNSVPLVALKTLVARVYPYFSQGFAVGGPAGIGRVTGELVLMAGTRVVYRTGPTRADGARVGPSRELDRTLWDRELTLHTPVGDGLAIARVVRNASLNFVVPAWYCRAGVHQVVVRLWPVDDGPASSLTATGTATAQFLGIRAPRLALVRVNWDNGMGGITAPTDVAMLDTVRDAEARLPFPYFETTILGVELTRTGNFGTPVTSGGCNAAWTALMPDIAELGFWTQLFQLGSLLYGMVPPAGAVVPAGSDINAGCRIGAGAGGLVGFVDTFAHEIGHAYERPHVAVPGDDDNDPAYPNYGGSTTSIGEVGIDTSTSTPRLLDPAATHDIMSYEFPQWTSPYTYRALLDARHLHQQAKADPRRVRGWLVVAIRVHRTMQGTLRVELRKATRVEAPGTVPASRASRRASFFLDLVGHDDRILATHPLRDLEIQGCGCRSHAGPPAIERQPHVDFVEAIPLPAEEITHLAVHRGGEPIDIVHAGDCPSLEVGAPTADDGRVSLEWRASHPRVRPAVTVLFSHDDGVSWQPVAVDAEERLAVDTSKLPGGERCRFRVLASAELCTVGRDTEPIALRGEGRRLYVAPLGCDCVPEGSTVTLRALVDSRGLEGIGADDVRWHSSAQGELGVGLQLVARLEAGSHEVTASAPDGRGGTMTARAIIIVGGRPR